jgi:histidine triad (HIT) family protein
VVRLNKDEALEQLEQERAQSTAFGGCVMCRLGSPLNAHDWIADSEHGVVVLDGYGATRGHLLVISKGHVERTSQLTWDVYSDLQRLVWQSTRVVEQELKPRRVYVAALGASEQLPMSFPHYHCHVVPVYEAGDAARPSNVFSWSGGVERYSQEEAQKLAERLRGAWSAHLTQAARLATTAPNAQG